MIAYFVMECAVDSRIPTYSGGLGILAGDTLQSFADLEVPAVCVTLLWKSGFTGQKLASDGTQLDSIQEWDVEKYMQPANIKIKIPLGGKDVTLTAYKYTIESTKGDNEIDAYFLTPDVPENDPETRKICDRLYIEGGLTRLKQEIILGIGGYEMLKAIKYKPFLYHINESHSAFLIASLMKDMNDLNRVKSRVVFTTHSPIPATFDKFAMKDVAAMLERYVDKHVLYEIYQEKLEDNDELNLSWLAIKNAKNVVAVSRKHKFVSEQIFEGYRLKYVTNGIHHIKWASAHHKMLYTKYIKGWEDDPDLLRGVACIPDSEFAQAHILSKESLIEMVNSESDASFIPEDFTIAMAKRVTQYKRNNLILSNPNKLIDIAERKGNIQIIFAGKTHPADPDGIAMIKSIHNASQYIASKTKKVKIAFLENYNIHKANIILAGVDLWLNNPVRPLEASGTSGMKASLNGVPNFSVLDGWWLEACMEGINGWGIGPRPAWTDLSYSDDVQDLNDIYGKLEFNILDLYYKNFSDYLKIMKMAVSSIAPYFNTHRMVSEYVTDLYLTGIVMCYLEREKTGVCDM
ncbi:MAG: alpha-glucan family phosphorylase [Deltaproteobacteria bacterium]|jgi:starch phosphorylase|nr:alpha-glucan family phosphorylase [Deltaproteobacteria bacterium]MCL5880676.1 alpha-glucan family phosphorylase [Deltaproteobacteria bacterium]MDA8305187.1 alpha-glucan family phosphorylase [Deltaproteobacteria bacterium]